MDGFKAATNGKEHTWTLESNFKGSQFQVVQKSSDVELAFQEHAQHIAVWAVKNGAGKDDVIDVKVTEHGSIDQPTWFQITIVDA